MYLQFFGFREKPFSSTQIPRSIFLATSHREAFAHLWYGVNNNAGFIELTGEAGTGKTALLRSFQHQLDQGRYRSALLPDPCLSPLELLRAVNRAYGLAGAAESRAELLDSLNRFLLEQKSAGRIVLLIIDGAHNLNPESLEQIRLISNLETETSKLINIVLSGRKELESLLARTDLRQLRQRISVRCHLSPMDFEDTRGYIEHHLAVAGGQAVFSAEALKRIHRFSGGVPRLIDTVCDQALLIGHADKVRVISGGMAAKAVRSVGRGARPLLFPGKIPTVALLTLLVLAAAGILLFPGSEAERQAARPSAKPSVKQAQQVAAVDPVDPVEGLRRGLHDLTEAESAYAAFKTVAGLWKVDLASPAPNPDPIRGLESLARKKGLQLASFSGSLDLLLRANSPAILECTVPGQDGPRYLALYGRNGDRLLIAPPLAGQGSLSSEQLQALWSGRAYLLWKNFYYIRANSQPGSKGWRVTRLQELLSRHEVYRGQPSGVFDAVTLAAVKEFQSSHGLEPDGRLGALTLPLLYHGSPEFDTPQLDKMDK